MGDSSSPKKKSKTALDALVNGGFRRLTRGDPGKYILPAKQNAFLAAFKKCGTIQAAVNAVGLPRNAVYRWIRENPEFAEKFEMAKAVFCEGLEAEAIRQAHDPTDKTHGPMLMFLMKAHMPRKYGDKPWQAAGVNVGAINVIVNIPRPTREAIGEIVAATVTGAIPTSAEGSPPRLPTPGETG